MTYTEQEMWTVLFLQVSMIVLRSIISHSFSPGFFKQIINHLNFSVTEFHGRGSNLFLPLEVPSLSDKSFLLFFSNFIVRKASE